MTRNRKPSQTALADAIAKARSAATAELRVVTDGQTFTLSPSAVLVAREGMIAVETAGIRFAAVEPELSDHCDAPTREEIANNPKAALDNPYTNSDHPGYAAIRALLRGSDPAIQMAEDYVKSHEKDDATKLAADPNWTFANNVKNDANGRVAKAVGWLYKAWKKRVGIVAEVSEPDGTTTLVKDFAEKLRKRAGGKQKGVPEADVKLAAWWYNLIDWAMHNREAATQASYRHSLGLKTPAPQQSGKPSEVRQLSEAELAAVNAQLDKALSNIEGGVISE